MGWLKDHKAKKEAERKDKERRAEIREMTGSVVQQNQTGKAGRKEGERRQLDAQRANEIKKAIDKRLREFQNECRLRDCEPEAEEIIYEQLIPQVSAVRLEGDLDDAETVAKFVLDSIDMVLLAIRQGDTYAAVIGVNFIQEWLAKLATPGFSQHFADPNYVKACKDKLELQIRIENNERLIEANRAAAAKIKKDFEAGRVTGTRAQNEIDKIKAKNALLRQQNDPMQKQLAMKEQVISKTEMVQIMTSAGSARLSDDMGTVLDQVADVTDDLNQASKLMDKLNQNNTASSSSSITSFNDNSNSISSDEPATLDLSGL